jgi:phytanoyl-CoA hydroxylase
MTTDVAAEHTGRAGDLTPDGRLPQELVDAYRTNGFVRIRGMLTTEEVAHFNAAAKAYLDRHRSESLHTDGVFTQLVNVWQHDEAMKQLTLHPRIARVAEQLAGFSLRIWHDQMLVKEPHNDAATEFHQDRPYWPHQDDRGSLSAWIALVDVPPERGCMTFLPGTQHLKGFRPQNLRDEEDLFEVDPSLRWQPRVTLPLRAGDCTFHSSYTGHMALPNRTDQARLAHVSIYMDAETTYTGAGHVVTDPLGLRPGDPLDGETFPRPQQVKT